MASACLLSMSEAVNARAMARGSNMAPLLGVGRWVAAAVCRHSPAIESLDGHNARGGGTAAA